MLFKEVALEWWIGDKINLRDISIAKKENILMKHVIPYLGDKDIRDVTDINIIEFMNYELSQGNHLTGEGLFINSVIKEISIVKNILSYAAFKHYVDIDYGELIKKLKKEPSKEYDIFTCEEVEQLIKVARPKWMGDMILLAYNTGMRKCECFGLQWDDINFDIPSIYIQRSVTASKPNNRFITDTKTKSGRREIWIDDYTKEMLAERYEKRTSDVWVFATPDGRLLSPWYSTKYFLDAKKKLGIKNKRFYDLRHTHITELLAAGTEIAVVQYRAGHANINMTMHYTHIKPYMQQGTVAYLNDKYKKRHSISGINKII